MHTHTHTRTHIPVAFVTIDGDSKSKALCSPLLFLDNGHFGRPLAPDAFEPPGAFGSPALASARQYDPIA